MRKLIDIILGAKCCNTTSYTCNKCPYNNQLNCFQELEDDLTELYEKLAKEEKKNEESHDI